MSHGEWFETGLAEMLAANPRLREEALRLEGGALNAVLHAIAAVGDELDFRQARAFRANFLDTAEGDDLIRLCASDYNVTHKGETAARVSLTFSRSATDAFTIETGTVVSTSDGVRFTVDTTVEWAALDVTDKSTTGTAIDVGAGSNVAAYTVTAIETSLTDTTVTVTNSELAAGGAPDEPPAELRARVRDVWARAVRGTVEANRLGALEVDQVRTAAVYEPLDDDGRQIGGVEIVIGDANGNATDAMVTDVELELYGWRAAGVYANVTGETVVYETVSVTATWDPGAATVENRTALKRAIVARVNRLRPRPASGAADINCQLRVALLHEAAATVVGCKGLSVVTLPAGTVEPAAGEVIRLRMTDVTVS